MNKPLILVVENDTAVCNLITTTLETHDYRFHTAGTGEAAILEAVSHNPDIVLLDLGLPDMDGIDIITKIRTWSNMPIIVVSARSEDTDKIDALDAGADDYLTKPFLIGELLARIRVALRKSQPKGTKNDRFTLDGLMVDFDRRKVVVDGKEVHLTPMEYKLLTLLIQYAGRVLTHSFINKEIWGYPCGEDSQSLRVLMANIRRKIEKDTANPRYILTEVGVGYRFVDE